MISRGTRGFTLIELMIVVAIVGILSVIAVVGVRRYLANAKSAEARQMLGGIARSIQQNFEREKISEILPPGTLSVLAMRSLCGTAVPVPAGVPAGKKYQSRATDWGGDSSTGWKCLRFSIDQPQFYRYSYTKGSSPVSGAAGSPATVSAVESFEAAAEGDLDADGNFSTFAIVGQLESDGAFRTATVLFEKDVEE